MVSEIPKDRFFAFPEALCFSCRNAGPLRCAFFALKEPERGLKTAGADAVKTILENYVIGGGGRKIKRACAFYKVYRCRNYQSDGEVSARG